MIVINRLQENGDFGQIEVFGLGAFSDLIYFILEI